MRLSWNEIRVRAKAFSERWKDAHYEKGETQTFYNEFFQIFGVDRRSVGRYEEHVKKLDNKNGFIDLFWPGTLIVEQKSAGRNLTSAAFQAGEYFDALKEKDKPRYQLVSDFQNFELLDRDEREEWAFPLSELSDNIEAFGFILGIQKRKFRDQDPVNIQAAETIGKLHDVLEKNGYSGHKLEILLVRLVFCLFADDTGIFEPKDLLLEFLIERTSEDGSDLGLWLGQLFQVLNTPEEERMKTLDEDLVKFPYINGNLFQEFLPLPSFNSEMRNIVLEAAKFNWSAVSPAIFGSLFQSVMDEKQRRQLGAHYTSEANILKVIEPLFMDDLRDEFQKINTVKTNRIRNLKKFQQKLGTLKLFDPACGCGNFLVIAYRELRQLELDVMREIYATNQPDLMADTLSYVNVNQFYGIEYEEFPSRIAEISMWMMDHIMNNKLSLEFGEVYVRIPLKQSPHIHHNDALEVDWEEVLPADECSYIIGNPPFYGAKNQSEKQRAQVHRIAKLGKGGGTLDYVACWYLKAGAYVKGATRIGFVSTNSICQGEQVAQLWPQLFDRYKLEIAFAHRTFAWTSEAKGKAAVHCVIIGLDRAENERPKKQLYYYANIKAEPEEQIVSKISPYLFDAGKLTNPHLCVVETSKSINGLPKLITGTQALDDGELTFTEEEKDEFIKLEPLSEKCFRKFPGAREFINSKIRWILHTQDLSPTELKAMPLVRERLEKVRIFRNKSDRATTKRLASYPSAYGVTVLPDDPFLIIPQTSSEKREYVPIAWEEPPTIPSEKLRILMGADKPTFGILVSHMHMAWMRAITGRMKSDYMYSVGVVYNNFPMPKVTSQKLDTLIPYVDNVLKARSSYPDLTLSDLYDPSLMPVNLRKAHDKLDRAVDLMYRKQPFKSEQERIEHLFEMYRNMLV